MKIRQRILAYFLVSFILILGLGVFQYLEEVGQAEHIAFEEAELTAKTILPPIAEKFDEKRGGICDAACERRLQQLTDRFKRLQNRDFVVVDARERIIADVIRSERGTIFSHDLEGEVEKTIADGKARAFTEISPAYPEGIRQIATRISSESGMTLGALILEYTPRFRQISAYRKKEALTSILIFTSILSGSFLLAYGISRRIIRPTLAVKDAAVKIAGGDYGSQVAVDSADEIGEMAVAFNAMSAKMRETIADLHRAKAELEYEVAARRKSEERYRALVETATSIILVWDTRGSILFINGYGESFFGFEKKELFGRNVVGTIVPQTESSGRDLAYLMMEIQKDPDRFRDNENENTTRDGRRVWIRWANKAITDETGALSGILSVGIDITDRKTSERELRIREERLERDSRILDLIASTQLNFIKDKSSSEVFGKLLADFLDLMNSEYGFIGEVFYTESGKPFLKTHTLTNIAWNDETRKFYDENESRGFEFYNLETLFGEVMKTGKAVISSEPHNDPRRGVLPEGHPALRSFLGLPFLLEGKMAGMAGIANRPGGYDEDMVQYLTPFATVCANIIEAYRIDREKKEAEEELRLHREQLEALVGKRTEDAMKAMHLASIGELAAGVAHEINNPINSVINYAQILDNRSAPDSRENEISKRIIKEGVRISHIVRNLLSFGREIKDEKKKVRMDEVFSDAAALMAAQLQKDGIRLIVDMPEDLPEMVVNPQQLQQVFINALSNSRYALNEKFPEPHEDKKIEVVGRASADSADPCLRIVITDYGSGIREELLDKVMKPFFTTKPSGKGTGLGLSLSLDIIKKLNGEFFLESRFGVFTRVVMELPLGENHERQG